MKGHQVAWAQKQVGAVDATNCMRAYKNIQCLLWILAMSLSVNTYAQDSLKSSPKKPVDVDFLFNYYEQDGNHSPVTGGTGTEKLNDIANTIVVHIPIDSAGKLTVANSVNFYSSASTDNINSKVSSASRNDLHWQVSVNYEREKTEKNRALSISASASTESDYVSSSLGFGWSKWTEDKNNYFNASLKAYFDTWILIFPEELRATALRDAHTDKRRSFIWDLSYTRVFTKKIQASFFIEPVYQKGFLSTPFHRVYFADTTLLKIEKLPDARLKLPMGFRLNSFIGNFFVLRLFNRFYWDDYGIVSNSASIEPVFKISSNFSVYPFYRFHTQSASTYFAPYLSHSVESDYYTSDYDLSAFNSHKIGIGIQLTPVWMKPSDNGSPTRRAFRSLGLRYSRYYRSDGLNYWMISSAFSFSF